MENRSARRAASILKLLGESGYPLGLSQVARQLELHPSTTHRLLAALTIEGLVEQDPETLKYGLSVELFALGRAAVRHLGISDRVQAELRALGAAVGETVNLGVVRRRRVIYLFSVESQETLRTSIKVGSSLPAHATAIGKAILASASPETIEAYLQQTPLEAYTPSSILMAQTLRQRLEQIRRDGYTVDLEECHLGVRAVGAPVCGPSGTVIAGLAATGPAARMGDPRLEEIIRQVVGCAQKISRLFGYFDEGALEIDSLTEAILV